MPASLSIWNEEAQSYQDRFLERVCDRYRSEYVQAYNSQVVIGETIYHNEPAWGDVCAQNNYRAFAGADAAPTPGDPTTEAWLKQSYLATLTRQQAVFQHQGHGEIWSSLHRQIAAWYDYQGCKYTSDVYAAYRALWPESVIHAIQYTFIQWPNQFPDWRADRDTYGVQVWGGAEYITGLPKSVPTAMSVGIRGLIMSPCRGRGGQVGSYDQHPPIDDAALELIGGAIGAMRRARGIL
jgi:hypothetical protein